MKTITLYSVNYTNFSKIDRVLEEFTLSGRYILYYLQSVDINDMFVFSFMNVTESQFEIVIGRQGEYSATTLATLMGIL